MAQTARNWYPVFPATSLVAPGYQGLLGLIGEPMSGLEIWLETKPGATDLDELPFRAPRAPVCREPVYEAMRPLFDSLAGRARELYRDREQRLKAVERWSLWVTTPFDFLSYAQFLRALGLEDDKDRLFAVSAAAAVLSRLEPPPCGATFLMGPVNVDGAVHQLLEWRVNEEILSLAFAEFARKLLQAPICRDDGEEEKFRSVLAERAGIATDETAKLSRARRVLDEAPPRFEEPGEVREARRKVERALNVEDAWQEYEARWRAWQPEGKGYDWRLEDYKLSTLTRNQVPRLARMKLVYLAGHRLKKDFPSLWLGHVQACLEALKGQPKPQTADDGINALAAYIK